MKTITHLTSVHGRFDIRIFHKELKSLVHAGYKVNLVVADGLHDAQVEGVKIIDCGMSINRWHRISLTQWRIYFAAVKTKAEIYHFHDPELIFTGLVLRLKGAKVIFDSHEDVEMQILQKQYLPEFPAKIISVGYRLLEILLFRWLSGIVSVTEGVDAKFINVNETRAVVSNYPMSNEFSSETISARRDLAACYVGMITRGRGAIEMVQAIQLTKRGVKLHLMGDFEDRCLIDEIKKIDIGKHVIIHPYSSREQVKALLSRCMVGLCILHPLKNHLHSLPNKMFEYMSAGLPVIASDFPSWCKIIEKSGSGIVVSPFNVSAIAKNIDFMVSNPRKAERYSKQGLKYVRSGYNWSTEEKKLIAFYESLTH